MASPTAILRDQAGYPRASTPQVRYFSRQSNGDAPIRQLDRVDTQEISSKLHRDVQPRGRPVRRTGRNTRAYHHRCETGPPASAASSELRTRNAPKGPPTLRSHPPWRPVCSRSTEPAIPVAGQHNSCHKHTGRQCASGESRRGAREAEQHPPRLGARAGGRLAKIVDGSRGIGSRTTPRQWVEAMGGRHRQRDRFITGATTVVQR